MAAYNFVKRFAPAVESGEKRCTIRARRKGGYVPKDGEEIDLYTGMRTKKCRKLLRVKVKAVTPIMINTHNRMVDGVILDGHVLGPRQIHQLALRDGFDNVQEFAEFFNWMHGPAANLYLIEW